MNSGIEIDIVKVIEQKSGRKLPYWIARLVQRLIHEREINSILRRYGHLDGGDFLAALHSEFSIETHWANPENLPEYGRAIFVCNHPLGAFDGIGISHLLYQRYGSVRYLVNDMLYHLRPLQSVFLPVNTYGAQRKASVEAIQRVMESDVPVGTFPAGYCSRYYDGRVQDKAWQRSFVSMAVQYKRDIVPLHFVGRNSQHFYLIDRLRRAMGIGFDVCTALLPDEMFRARGKQFEVIVGAPISWQSIADSEARPQELADRIRQKSYDLVNLLSTHKQ